jgi:cyclase
LVQASRAIERMGPLAAAPLRLLGRLGIKQAEALLDAAEFVVDAFGPFEFGDVTLRVPNTTFEGKFELQVGDQRVELLEVGPAHTRGDVLVHVPSERIVYTGDILFIESHPIAWAGPVDNWIRACDRILALDAQVVVPGHGPLTDARGVRAVRDYWVELKEHARAARAAGLSTADAARELESRNNWTESERLVVNMDGLYRELAGDHSHLKPIMLLGAMGRAHRARS